MSQLRREVVFMGRDEGLSSTMESIRQSSNETARAMIENARQSNSTAEGIVQSYDDQIRAMERKARISSQTTRMEIDDRRRLALEELESKEVVSPKEQEERKDKIDQEAEREISQIRQEISEEEREVKVKEIEQVTREKIEALPQGISEEERDVRIKEIEKVTREKIDSLPQGISEEEREIKIREIEQTSREKSEAVRQEMSEEERQIKVKEIEDISRQKIQALPQATTQEDRERRIFDIEERSANQKSEIDNSTIGSIDRTFEEKKINNQYKKEVEEQKRAEAEDKIQIQVLKDILAAINSTSRQEISTEQFEARRESQNEQIRDLSEVGGAVEVAQQLNEERTPDPDEPSNNNRGGGAAGFIQDGGRIINGSPVDAAQGGAGMMGIASNPYVAAVLATAAVGYGAVSQLAGRETSASELAALTGTSSERIATSDIGSTEFGSSSSPLDYNVKREEFLSQYMPRAIRSAGTTENAEERAIQQIEIDKGLGLTQGTASQIEKIIRVSGESSAQTLTAEIYNALRDAGELGEDGKDLAKLDEYMRGFIQMSEQAFMQFGVSENQGTIGAIKELTKLGGNFEREDYTIDATRRMNAGLVQGGSAESQAIKMDILRQNNPDLGFAELQAEMQKGLNSEKYASSLFDFAKNSSQDVNNQALVFNELTGGQMRMADILQMMKSGEFSLDALNEEQEITRDPKFDARARNAASSAQTDLDFMKEGLKDLATKMGDGLNSLIDEVRGIRGDVNTSMEMAKTMDR